MFTGSNPTCLTLYAFKSDVQSPNCEINGGVPDTHALDVYRVRLADASIRAFRSQINFNVGKTEAVVSSLINKVLMVSNCPSSLHPELMQDDQ